MREERPWAECSAEAPSKGLQEGAELWKLEGRGRVSLASYSVCAAFRLLPTLLPLRACEPRGQGSTDHQRGSVVMCHKAQGLTDHLSLLRIKILWKKIIKRKK